MDSKIVVCDLLEIEYMKKMREKLNLDELNEYMIRKVLFPNEWQVIDIDTKLICLKEAIDNEKTLIETSNIKPFYKKL